MGHIISEEGIEPEEEKVSAIKNMRPPDCVRGVRSFIGMVGYYRKFIKGFSEIARPLTNLTKKNARFLWTDEAQCSFDTLKEKLMTAPILGYPDTSEPYKLYTDASQYAVGAILTQDSPTGERVIQYVSHKLSDGQQKWPCIEREAFAIIYAISKLRQYLYGSTFTVYTDHKPLRSLFTSEMKNTRVQRWATLLEEYGCSIQYKSGKQNVRADMLSRIDTGNEEDSQSVNPEINLIDTDVDTEAISLDELNGMPDVVAEPL